MPNLYTEFEYLIQNIPPDDPRVITELVEAYRGYIVRLVSALVNESEIELVLEAIFLRAAENLDQYLVGSNFKLWFTKLAIKECRSINKKHLRQTLRWPPPDIEVTEEIEVADIASWRVLSTPNKQLSLPLILNFNLNLTIAEISQVLRLRESVVLDRLDKGIQRLLTQQNPSWSGLPRDHSRNNVHRACRRQLFQTDQLSGEDHTRLRTHLDHCRQCQTYSTFVKELGRVLPATTNSENDRIEDYFSEVRTKIEKKNQNTLRNGRLRKPGQEAIWVLLGVGLVLGIGWFFNQINPLVEVQQAIQAQITPTLVPPLEPLSGQAHQISTPVIGNTEAETGTESSWNPRISGQGNHLVFTSSIRHLVEGDNNSASDIFLYDMETGGVERVSITTAGEEANNGSYEPSISGDGRYVVFSSWADNLTHQDDLNCEYWNTSSSCPDIFLHDRELGTTILVSRTEGDLPGNNFSFSPEISQDGNLIAFWSAAGDLVPEDNETCGNGEESHNCIDLFLYDISQDHLDRVSIGRNFNEKIPRHFDVSLSADGDLILITLDTTDRLGAELQLKNPLEVFLYHRSTGQFEPINLAVDGAVGNGPSFAGNISPDGRWVVWASLANNLTGADENEFVDVYLRDLMNGTVERISNAAEGGELDGDSGIIGGQENWFGDSLSVSDGGRYVVFTSTANDLAPDQENYCGVTLGCRNVFLYDRTTEETTQLNTTNVDFIPFISISANGNYGTYMAQSLSCSHLNFCLDIFVFNQVEGIVAQLGSYGIRTGGELPTKPLSDDRLTLNHHSRWVLSLAYSPDGRYLASGSRDQSVIVWSVAEETRVSELDGELVAFSPDGNLLAAADEDRKIYLWRMPQGQLTGVLNSEIRARDLAFSPDGNYLAAAGSKGVYLWDVEGRTLEKTFSTPSRVARAISFSPDGNYLAAGIDDHTIWIFNLPDGGTLSRLGGHEDKVGAVAFSPDGQYFASGSNDNTVNLWRIQARPEGPLDAERIHQFHHKDWVTSLAFTPDNQMLATGSFDHSIALWDVSTGALVHVPYHQTQNQVLSLAFSPADGTFAAGNVRGEVHFWRSLQFDTSQD